MTRLARLTLTRYACLTCGVAAVAVQMVAGVWR